MSDGINSKRILIFLVALMSIGWAGSLLFEKKVVITEQDDISNEKKAPSKINRKIASQDKRQQKKSLSPRHEVLKARLGENTIDRKNEVGLQDEVDSEEQYSSAPSSDVTRESDTSYSSIIAPIPSSSDFTPSTSAPSSSTSSNGQTLAQATFSKGGSVTFGNIGSPTPSITPTTGIINKPPQSSTNTGNVLTCSASVPNGSYSYALSVTLSCSSSAAIKYCLSEGSCCDPNSSSGKTYSNSTPIVIGENNSQYCLSYYAVGKSSKTDVAQKVYQINKQIPDLYVETPVTWMQTTEAPINSNIISLNFGKNDFSLAQISYFSHDIGPDGDHLSCEEVATEMSSYTSPSPLHTLSLLSVSGLSTSQQVEVPLSPASLEYGTNYIATYMVNTSRAIPTYACSISEITLMDFPFFDSSAISDSGEFVGGFTPFGFYEENFDFPRAPAGQSSSGDTDQKIETAFLTVIY